VTCRLFDKDVDLGKSVVVAECRYDWPWGCDILPVGEFSDSSARMVMTWALMMESAIMLSDVFRL
jgi:hypothetical protein